MIGEPAQEDGLPDRTYIHRDEDHIYDFTDVTDLLRERE